MKINKSGVLVLFFGVLSVLLVLSYGYIDPNLTLSTNPVFLHIQEPLKNLAYHQRPIATMLFFAILIGLFVCYGIFLKHAARMFVSWKQACIVLGISAALLVFSYPALTYDLFNYIATAKVTYQYHENPYIVMPIEIPNEPNLAFTRAANKLALYGPVWILFSAVGYVLGAGTIWGTIIAFKIMNAIAYIGFAYLIYRVTKSLTNVLFFALNPLVLIEVLMNGHNDIYMMLLAIGGFLLWQRNRKAYGFLLLAASWLVKGATIILAPLLFLKNISRERLLLIAYCLLSFVFFVIAPIREELYPWYAVWLVMTASLLPIKKHKYLILFTIVLTFALELRNLPYMWMGYYEGPGPVLRSGLTVIPIVFYAGYVGLRYLAKRKL